MTTPLNHIVGVWVPPDFSPVILKLAEAENITFSDALLKLAILGADCARTHSKKEAHQRRQKTK